MYGPRRGTCAGPCKVPQGYCLCQGQDGRRGCVDHGPGAPTRLHPGGAPNLPITSRAEGFAPASAAARRNALALANAISGHSPQIQLRPCRQEIAPRGVDTRSRIPHHLCPRISAPTSDVCQPIAAAGHQSPYPPYPATHRLDPASRRPASVDHPRWRPAHRADGVPGG